MHVCQADVAGTGNNNVLYVDSSQYRTLSNRIKRTSSGLNMKAADPGIVEAACGTESLDLVSNYWDRAINADKKYKNFVSITVVLVLSKILKVIQETDNNLASSIRTTSRKKGIYKPGTAKDDSSAPQPKLEHEVENEKKVAKVYKSLPKELKKYVTQDDIRVTDDGYFIITKSLADIMREAGVNSADFDYESYDDWYISGLRGIFGKTTYSMVKVREPMDDQGHKGTTVPFVSMDIDDITSCLHYYSGEKSNNSILKFIDSIQKKKMLSDLDHTIDDVVYSYKFWNNLNYNQEMLNYFASPSSEGSYLIADFAVEKVANDAEFDDGAFSLKNPYTDFDKHGQALLDNLATKGIYDKDTNTIFINRADGLNEDERNALLLITTGDSDIYAYAGENQFHADIYPIKPSHSIASDAGVGEDPNEGKYAWSFKEEWGIYKAEQELFHGKHGH